MNSNTNQIFCPPSDNEIGFTLIETSVALFASLVILLGFYSLQNMVQSNQVTLLQNYMSLDATNNNLSHMVKTIRTAQPSANGSYLIESAGPNELILFSDIDYDNIIERVRFRLIDTRLEQGIIKPSGTPATYPSQNESIRILADHITNGSDPLFTYYNRDWPVDMINNPLPLPIARSSVRAVKIQLKSNFGDEARDAFLLNSLVFIRTLKDNL